MRFVELLSVVLLTLAALGCASTCPTCPPPPPPEVITEEVYRCPDPGDLPRVVLPKPPPFPEGGDPSSIREWLVQVREILDARERILRAAIEARDAILAEYRRPPPG